MDTVFHIPIQLLINANMELANQKAAKHLHYIWAYIIKASC